MNKGQTLMKLFEAHTTPDGDIDYIELHKGPIDGQDPAADIESFLKMRKESFEKDLEDWAEDFERRTRDMVARPDDDDEGEDLMVEASCMQSALEKILRHTGRWV